MKGKENVEEEVYSLIRKTNILDQGKEL